MKEAYYQTLKTTGRAVLFTGLCLAIGVATWIFWDIKFQADLGIMLTFMFLCNMVGALWLLPSLIFVFQKIKEYFVSLRQKELEKKSYKILVFCK